MSLKLYTEIINSSFRQNIFGFRLSYLHNTPRKLVGEIDCTILSSRVPHEHPLCHQEKL